MKILLFDINSAVCAEFSQTFQKYPDIEVQNQPLDKLPFCDGIVAAGNSYGTMAGGIDLALREMYGQGLQDAIQNTILSRGLPFFVGEAASVHIDEQDNKKWHKDQCIIYAPTMFTPSPAIWHGVLSATVAALLLAKQMNLATLAIPGMGTGCGGLHPKIAADAIHSAYKAVTSSNVI